MTDTSRKGTMIVSTGQCIRCNRAGAIEVSIAGWHQWKGGASVQSAFPELDADQRELLMSGTHAHCWAAMMAEEEE